MFTTASFYDLTKAFDCVCHDRLLLKLNSLGFSPTSVNLLRSYLVNRKQYVTYNDTISEQLGIVHGVPQGSVLGPFLFLIFVNDLPRCIPENSKIILFADDTTTLNTSSDLSMLDRSTRLTGDRVLTWFTTNLLHVNESKTQSLTFSLRPFDRLVQSGKIFGRSY